WDYWNSYEAISRLERSLRIGSVVLPALVALIVVLALIQIGNHKEQLRSQIAWRSIPHLQQRMITEYLRPHAGEQVTVLIPDENSDAEAVNFGRINSELLSKAGWQVSLVTNTLGTSVAPGFYYRVHDPEYPALAPLLRAYARAGITLEKARGGIPS